MRTTTYPFRALKKGDVFTAGRNKERSVRALASIRGSELGRVFSVKRRKETVLVRRVK